MSFLTLQNVSHYYFSKTGYMKALEDVDFSVDKAEFISLIGPSGCGKSTVLSLIAQLMKQTEGKILVDGTPLANSPIQIGYMLQQDYLFPWRTILENVTIGPKIQGKLNEKQIDKAKELLQEVGLENVGDKYPGELSGGMRQRAALVRTLMNDPEILLFDEPFSALDYVTKLHLENLVASLMKTYNKTAILVTHDLAEAIAMSDRILLMEPTPGRIGKTFTIPDALRKETPFLVRRHEAYQAIFDKIWHHIQEAEKVMTNEKDN